MRKWMVLSLFCYSFYLTAQVDSTVVISQVDSLFKAARNYQNVSQFSEALKTVTEAKSRTEGYFGKQHSAYIEACSIESQCHWRMGNYPLALASCDEGIALQVEAWGKDNAVYSDFLHLRGTLHLEMSNYQTAINDFNDCLPIREKHYGKSSAKYAMSLNNLGNTYSNAGELDLSKKAHLEAKQIREKVIGVETIDYAMSLANLGRLSLQIGEVESSVGLLTEAMVIVEKTKGKDHYLMIMSVANLAIAYTELGFYGKAETTFNQALALCASSMGMEHPHYAFILHDLGSFYLLLGLLDKARECFLKSLDIKSKTLGEEHRFTLATWGNLARIFQETSELEQAASIYLNLIGIYQKNNQTKLRENLTSLNNLANIYLAIGDITLADSLHNVVLDLRRTDLGSDHPDCANSLQGIAQCQRKQGNSQEAISNATQAQNIYKNTYGNHNLLTISSHKQLAEIHWDFEQPTPLLQESGVFRKLLTEHLFQAARHLSANELQLIMPGHLNELDFVQSARIKFGQNLPEQLEEAYDDALIFKGMLLENAIELETAMIEAPDALRKIYLDWKALQRRLAEKYTQPLTSRSGTKELEQRAELLEKELLQSVAFRSVNEMVSWQQVQSQLAATDAAIEFIHFNYKNPYDTDSVFYVALLLRPGWNTPHWVTLFEEKTLLPLLETNHARRIDYVTQLFDNQHGTSLYKLIWQSLEPHLEGVDRIYFSPTGILHRIPLAAIRVSENETLCDRYALHQLGSTRQLAYGTKSPDHRINSKPALANGNDQTALIFGGIVYEMDSTAIASSNDLLTVRQKVGDDVFSESTRSLARGGKSWKYLPWTEVEAKILAAIFKNEGLASKLQLGHAATEELFYTIGATDSSPQVLHIATHGYFYPDPGKKSSNEIATIENEPVFKISEHPMIRSGLILAGANHAWTGGQPLENLADGILTAYEVSQMHLRETELVVLSACETGLGDIKGNEGVYGLQRAFKIAGVRYVLMSLWQVPDFATQDLMTAFYTLWLSEKISIPDAFHKAQQQVKAKRPEPYYWAGFVLVE